MMSGPEELRVFETTHPLRTATDWQRSDVAHLVLYNFHYFDDLNTAGARDREPWHRSLMDRWIVENPPGQGTGWEPYPLSIRIVNWIKWALRSNALDAVQRNSLATQVHALSQQLEYHLLANHLFANAKALAFAGVFFEGDRAARWLQLGTGLLERELKEQILADGGHFELSPMYHATILEDLLDLYNLSQVYANLSVWSRLRPLLEAKIAAMRWWLAVMSHPDGQISFFNDAALGVAAEPAELARYAARLQLPAIPAIPDGVTPLEASGYVRLQNDECVVILDAAEVGPTYQPGHAHADTLAWEWSWRGQRLAVNSGTSVYGVSPERHRQRSTAAHNTVVVNNENSSDVWSGFRVGRRARPGRIEWHREPGKVVVRASHDGYRRHGSLHTRQWTISDRQLTIRDQLEGSFRQAESRIHLHPRVTAKIGSSSDQIEIGVFSLGAVSARLTPGGWLLNKSTYHPRFEVSEPNQCLVAPFTGGTQEVTFDW